MAILAEKLLKSGRAIRVAKLTTKQYLVAQERAANKFSEGTSTLSFGMALSKEILLSSLRAITLAPLPSIEVKDQPGVLDEDAMLDAVLPTAWVSPTFENLITEGPLSLDSLLDDPGDYTEAVGLAQQATFPNRGAGRSIAGKTRTVSVES